MREQPGALERLIGGSRAAVEAVAAAVRAYGPTFALFAARGSSDNAARYAQYVLGAHNRLAVGLAAPALHTVYGAAPALDGALVVGVSQSGQSPDVVAVIDDARAQGALTLAVTNDEGSPLARAAQLRLPAGVGEERAVAASKTYTGQLAAIAALSAALAGDEARRRELEALPAAVAAALDAAGAARAAAATLAGAGRVVVLGRGFNLATAFEIALKLKETSYLAAEPYSWADFLHGPVAMVEPGFPVVLVAPSGRASEGAHEIATRLVEQGAALIVLSDRAGRLASAAAAVPLPAGVPEWLSPMTAVVAGQLLALATAEARGTHPDRPRGLAKITHTR
ncbi:MAG: SIS domain-containing protein [Polyangiaceae bacterium]|nr:SIS domain-containing protein [Polyangiaceae bacterium]